jgi:hypothetical protein
VQTAVEESLVKPMRVAVQAMGAPLSVNATVPVGWGGVASPLVTVAVNATGCPTTAGELEDTTVVVDGVVPTEAEATVAAPTVAPIRARTRIGRPIHFFIVFGLSSS